MVECSHVFKTIHITSCSCVLCTDVQLSLAKLMFMNKMEKTSRIIPASVEQRERHRQVDFKEGRTCSQVRTQEEMTAEICVSCGNCGLTQVPPAVPCFCHKADFALWHISLPHCLTPKSPFTSVFLELEGLGQSQVHLEQIPAFPSIIKQRRRRKKSGAGVGQADRGLTQSPGFQAQKHLYCTCIALTLGM